MTINELPIGSVLYMGGSEENLPTDSGMLRWVKIDKDNRFVLSGNDTCFGAMFDYCENNSPSRARRNHGNNFYPLSNVHQYLNATGEEWFKPTHQFDTNPMAQYNVGFFSHFAPAELAAMITQTVPYKIPRGSIKEMGDKLIGVTAKVILPSASMICNDIEPLEDEFNMIVYREVSKCRGRVITRTGGDNPSRVLAVNSITMEADNVESDDRHTIMPIIQLNGEVNCIRSGDMLTIVEIAAFEPDDLSILFA